MSREALLTLGGYPFQIDRAAYDELRRRTDYRWAEIDRMGAGPLLQAIGPGRDEIELSGTVFPHWKGGLWQIDALRALQALGQPLQLVASWSGPNVLGYWVILGVEEEQGTLIANGAPLRQDFRVALQYFGSAP